MKSKRGMIGQLIGGFVAILIGISLFPTILNQINILKTNMTTNATMNVTVNNSTWATTVLDLVPALFALGILCVGITVAWSALKPLFGNDEDEYIELNITSPEEESEEEEETEDDDDEEEEKIEEIEDEDNEETNSSSVSSTTDILPELTDKKLKEKSKSFDKTKYD